LKGKVEIHLTVIACLGWGGMMPRTLAGISAETASAGGLGMGMINRPGVMIATQR
jgi:hypothetical protein